MFKTASRNNQRRVDNRARRPDKDRQRAVPESENALSILHNELVARAQHVLDGGKRSQSLRPRIAKHLAMLQNLARRRGVKAEHQADLERDLSLLNSALRMLTQPASSGVSSRAAPKTNRSSWRPKGVLLACPNCSANVRQDRLSLHLSKCRPRTLSGVSPSSQVPLEAAPSSPTNGQRIAVPSPVPAAVSAGDPKLLAEVQRLRQENAALKAGLLGKQATVAAKKPKKSKKKPRGPSDVMNRRWSLVYGGAFDSNRRRH
jgi:hypothetical protein